MSGGTFHAPRAPFALREACGVFAVAGDGIDLARVIAFGLQALQHRGQDSAGIVALDGATLTMHRGPGLVADVLTEVALGGLHGEFGVGHVRYATAGTDNPRNIQPFVLESPWGPVVVAHNGNITNTKIIAAEMMGVSPQTIDGDSDTALVARLIARFVDANPSAQDGPGSARWIPALRYLLSALEGAWSLVVGTVDGLFALRDPLGFRPLHLGMLPVAGRRAAWLAASETCALDAVGARPLREVLPGEVVHLGPDGAKRLFRAEPRPERALCSFEYVYFARADSVLEGQRVHAVRRALGRALAREAPADADLVVGIPDSALPAAAGFAEVARIPQEHALIRNREVGRTFIQPSEALRQYGVHLKFQALGEIVAGRRVVLVDDSIVRGTTVQPIVRLLREAGASEIHVRVASPPVSHPCYMGVAMPNRAELIRTHHDVPQLATHIGADSLAFLTLEGMRRVLAGKVETPVADTSPERHCAACFSGRYPLDVRDIDTE